MKKSIYLLINTEEVKNSYDVLLCFSQVMFNFFKSTQIINELDSFENIDFIILDSENEENLLRLNNYLNENIIMPSSLLTSICHKFKAVAMIVYPDNIDKEIEEKIFSNFTKLKIKNKYKELCENYSDVFLRHGLTDFCDQYCSFGIKYAASCFLRDYGKLEDGDD